MVNQRMKRICNKSVMRLTTGGWYFDGNLMTDGTGTPVGCGDGQAYMIYACRSKCIPGVNGGGGMAIPEIPEPCSDLPCWSAGILEMIMEDIGRVDRVSVSGLAGYRCSAADAESN